VLLNRELWDRLDGFDPSLIYTFEDADFSRRAALMGADISFSAQVGAHHAASSTGRRHVDTVLPVAAWSASEYLAKWVMPRPAARAFCVTALTCRLAVTPVAGLPVRSHIRGIRRAIGALVTGRPPALPEFERM